MNFFELQTKQKIMQEKNFPDTKNYQCLLGLMEEIGELAHAHLKCEQNIRGTTQQHRYDAADAIGDIMIFLAGYCNTNGYDLNKCVEDAWKIVEKRNWKRLGKKLENIN